MKMTKDKYMKYVSEVINRYSIETSIDAACDYLQKINKDYKEKGWENIELNLRTYDHYGSTAVYLRVKGYVEMTEKEKREQEERDKFSEAAGKMGMSEHEYSIYLRFKEKGLVKDG